MHDTMLLTEKCPTREHKCIVLKKKNIFTFDRLSILTLVYFYWEDLRACSGADGPDFLFIFCFPEDGRHSEEQSTQWQI